MLVVAATDVQVDGDLTLTAGKSGTTPADLRGLAEWLVEQGVEEVFSRCGAIGETPGRASLPGLRARRRAAALAHRLVPSREDQVTRNRVQLQNRLEALLEEADIKVSRLVSDLR